MARKASSGSRRAAVNTSGGKKPKRQSKPKAKASAKSKPKATASTKASSRPAKKPARNATKKAAKKASGTKPRASGPSAAEVFYDAKQKALEQVLGPMDEGVFHSIIPFAMGGSLDLYTFSSVIPGTVYVTQELIGPGKDDRTAAGPKGHYELVVCRKANHDSDEDGVNLVARLLNPIAQHAFDTPLGPGETAALPGEEDDSPHQLVLLTEFDPRGVPFAVGDETFFLLCVITIHESEYEFIQKQGVGPFLDKLKAAGEYPYSTLDRPAVA